MKVKILKATIGAFKMAYFAGMEADLPQAQAELLIESGFAEALEQEKAVLEVVAETPELNKKSRKK